MKTRSRSLLGTLITGAGIAMLSTTALAAEECKGKEMSACGASASCTWIDAYTTKTGNKVNAYCRSKGKKSGTPAASARPATTTASAAKATR